MHDIGDSPDSAPASLSAILALRRILKNQGFVKKYQNNPITWHG
jgi:hypothetical protein